MQRIVRYENGYGASIIRNAFSYGSSKGLVEVAVIAFNGDDWEIVYDTPVTGDVIGWLDKDGLWEVLRQIEALPPRNALPEGEGQ